MRNVRKTRIGLVVVIGILVMLAVMAAFVLIKRYAPSHHQLPLTEYYSVPEGEVLVVLQDTVLDEHAKWEDGRVYLEAGQIAKYLNKRFYWDTHENLLIYTTADDVIKAEPGKKNCRINKQKKETDYEIVKMDGDKVYIAVDFVKAYTDFACKVYDEPKRIVITYRYGEDLLFTKVKGKTPVRKKAGIKSDIVAMAAKGDVLQCLDEDAKEVNGFFHVITDDGVMGYISKRKAKEPYTAQLVSENKYEQDEYTHIKKDDKINLVWNQVYNQDANNQLPTLLEHAEGVTVLSPSWFRVTGTKGEITSLVSEEYVKTAHERGIEVWGMITDVDEAVDMYKVLSYTSKRQKIEKELIAQVIRNDLDGINIDFETITEQTAASYLQFIRELGIMCRHNNIVLSIDSYVPTSYTAYYDRAEQAAVADYVAIMAYDEHYAGGGESGSVASAAYSKQAAESTLKEVPADQILLGIPFYTRLWKETTKEDGSLKVDAENYSMINAWKWVKNRGITPVWDEETSQYYAEYEEDGVVYKMWLEDEKSIAEKVKVAHEYELAGTAAWKLGLEQAAVWKVIQKYIN